MPVHFQQQSAQLLAIFVGKPTTKGSNSATIWHDKPWTSAIHKQPVNQTIQLNENNLLGDAQADLKNHGGPHRALLIYPADHYPYWRKQLNLPTLPYGAFGENLTIPHFTESRVHIGDTFTLGSTIIQASQPRPPCWKLARRWKIKNLAIQVQNTGFAGWYARVLQTGTISPSDTLTLIDRPCPDWSIDTIARLKYDSTPNRPEYAQLADCPHLPPYLRDRFAKKHTSPAHSLHHNHDTTPRTHGPNID
ncbi:MOSC domain-containing protein [Poriferisphaera corsica]|uniref:MOSC domain-containing protein n=1 Tax=Poriferisphaera corsica TaxID=2528020 RepID=UPI001909DB71|nr:MOSC domain-containing protein [Poriferisphaera corsica]